MRGGFCAYGSNNFNVLGCRNMPERRVCVGGIGIDVCLAHSELIVFAAPPTITIDDVMLGRIFVKDLQEK
jgi:hypothetical protein